MLRRRIPRLLTAAALALLLAASAPAALAAPAATEGPGLARLSDWFLTLWSWAQPGENPAHRTGAQETLPTADPDGLGEAPAPIPTQSSQPADGDGETLPTADPNG